jgi:hypothetical protein
MSTNQNREFSEKSYDNTGYQKPPQSIQNDQLSFFQWQNFNANEVARNLIAWFV